MKNRTVLYLLIIFFTSASAIPQNVSCAVIGSCNKNTGIRGQLLESWMEHVHEMPAGNELTAGVESSNGNSGHGDLLVRRRCGSTASCCIFDRSIENNRSLIRNISHFKVKGGMVPVISYRKFEKPFFIPLNNLSYNLFAARQIYLKINSFLC